MRSLSPKSCFPLPSAQSQALAFHDPVGGSWGAFFTAHVSTVPVSDRCLILGHRTQRLNTQHARPTPTLCGFARCRCCCFRVRKRSLWPLLPSNHRPVSQAFVCHIVIEQTMLLSPPHQGSLGDIWAESNSAKPSGGSFKETIPLFLS